MDLAKGLDGTRGTGDFEDLPVELHKLSDNAEFNTLVTKIRDAGDQVREHDPVLRLLHPADEAQGSIQALVLEHDGVTLAGLIRFEVRSSGSFSHSVVAANGQLQVDVPPGAYEVIAYEIDAAHASTGRTAVVTTAVPANNVVSVTLLLPEAASDSPQIEAVAGVTAGSELVVHLTGPTAVVVGDVASFFAAVLSGGGGRPVSFVWDFGDGSAPLTTGFAAGHAYAAVGSYVVTVEATNWLGNSVTLVRHIVVLPQGCATGADNGATTKTLDCELGSFKDSQNGTLEEVGDRDGDDGPLQVSLGRVPVNITPPVTTIEFAGIHTFSGGVHHITLDTQIYFLATDENPVTIEYGVDQPPNRPAFPFKIDQARTYGIQYRGTDSPGNVEATNSATVMVSTSSDLPGETLEAVDQRENGLSTLVVTVLDSDGATPAGLVRVTVQLVSETRDLVVSDGIAEFPLLAAGVYQVVAHELEPSHEPTGRSAGGSVLIVAGGTTLDLVLQEADSAVDKGETPDKPAFAYGFIKGPDVLIGPDPTGKFEAVGFTGVPPLSYKWDFGDGTLGTGQAVEKSWAALSATSKITISLTATDSLGQEGTVHKTIRVVVPEMDDRPVGAEDAVRVVVSVVAADGQTPAANATVVAKLVDGDETIRAITDAKGGATLELAPGTYTIDVKSEDGLSRGTHMLVVATGDTPRLAVTLSPTTGNVTVSVTDPLANPVSGALVSLVLGATRSGTTDSTGQARIEDLQPGLYDLLVKPSPGAGLSSYTGSVEVLAGETSQVHVRLSSTVGILTIVVVDQDGRPAAGATVGVSSKAEHSRKDGTADAAGTVTFELASGSYVVEAKLADDTGGGSSGKATVTIVSGETQTVTITLVPAVHSEDTAEEGGRDGGETKDGGGTHDAGPARNGERAHGGDGGAHLAAVYCRWRGLGVSVLCVGAYNGATTCTAARTTGGGPYGPSEEPQPDA